MKKYFLYIGRNTDNQHLYKTFFDMSINDGRLYPDANTSAISKTLWKTQSVGQIFEVEVQNVDDTEFTYKKNSMAISRWKNIADVTKWQLADRATDLYFKNIKENKPTSYREQLTDIKAAYKAASYIQKPLILAEIISIITN